MKKVFFLMNRAGDSVFGVISANHGQLPAFFTDEATASAFLASKIEDYDQHTFGSTDDPDAVRHFLNFNEKSYVLLDGAPMTGVEMFEALKD